MKQDLRPNWWTPLFRSYSKLWPRTFIDPTNCPWVSEDDPAHEKLYHTTGVYAPYSLWTAVWVLLRPLPQESEQWKSCETGPTVCRPYPRRLECLTTCRCHNKGSRRPWVLVRPGFEPATSHSADRRLSNWANRAAIRNVRYYSSGRYHSGGKQMFINENPQRISFESIIPLRSSAIVPQFPVLPVPLCLSYHKQLSALKHTYQLRGMASTLHIRTTISPGQWPYCGVTRVCFSADNWCYEYYCASTRYYKVVENVLLTHIPRVTSFFPTVTCLAANAAPIVYKINFSLPKTVSVHRTDRLKNLTGYFVHTGLACFRLRHLRPLSPDQRAHIFAHLSLVRHPYYIKNNLRAWNTLTRDRSIFPLCSEVWKAGGRNFNPKRFGGKVRREREKGERTKSQISSLRF